MPIAINGSGTLTGLSVGGLENGIITPAELSTGGPGWDAQSNLTNVASINNGPLAGMRNRIINGDMRIDQRNAGASFTSSGLFYCLDRWLLQAVGATNTAQQVTGSTGNNKAVRITGNTGNTLTGFSQKIESWNILDLAAQTVTLSFTLSGSSAGAVSVRRLYPTAADNYTATTEPAAGTSINFTTTPIRYTLSFTLDANANKGFWLFFDFGGVGSGVTRTLEDVQLEPGTVATPFERRPIGTELSLCQRYFEKSFQQANAPAQAIGTLDGAFCAVQVVGQSVAQRCGSVTCKTPKRSTPTITLFNPIISNAQFYNGNSGGSTTSTVAGSVGENGFHLDTVNQAGSGAVGNGLFIHWTASAEL